MSEVFVVSSQIRDFVLEKLDPLALHLVTAVEFTRSFTFTGHCTLGKIFLYVSMLGGILFVEAKRHSVGNLDTSTSFLFYIVLYNRVL